MVMLHRNKIQKIVKPMKSRKTPFLDAKVQKLKNKAKQLFDICSCQCSDLSSCSCQKANKVPVEEWPFLTDQRTERCMVIGNVDKATTLQIQKRVKRNAKKGSLDYPVAKRRRTTANLSAKIGDRGAKPCQAEKLALNVLESESDNTIDEDFKWSYLLNRTIRPKKGTLITSNQMRIDLPNVAKAADLTGCSNRSVAKISNAILHDFKIISPGDSTYVVDKNKVRREIMKNRRRLQEGELFSERCIKGLYFDGRKDQTMAHLKDRRVIKPEEHIALIQEPGCKYLGHVTLKPANAVGIQKGIISFMEKNDVDYKKCLTVIGCDGTNVNTGWKGGVLRLLDLYIGRSVQWSICLLHTNELPLRHLLQEFDGHTKGPYSFSGPVGSLLNDCEAKPVVKFKKIASTTLPHIDLKDINNLSTDQRYLYRMCCAIKDGKCSAKLSQHNPGKLGHARWLTTANRLLRLYIATSKPTENFCILVNYIMKVYAPLWFQIKVNSLCQDGAKHFWNMIQLTRKFSDHVKIVTDKVFACNAYFAHPESILLAMITDARDHIRELGIRRILKARKKKSQGLRVFKLPKLSFEANDYVDMIDWNKCEITEPPLTKTISNKELEKVLQ